MTSEGRRIELTLKSATFSFCFLVALGIFTEPLKSHSELNKTSSNRDIVMIC